MINESEQVLSGGNMNAPLLKNNRIYKEATGASVTLHELLTHVRSRGIDWVPESFGINSEEKHVLEYLKGEVPHNNPDWIWDESILLDVAKRIRMWHDATMDFRYPMEMWINNNNEAREVICHNDFAPYNCVFRNGKFVGLIDFDVCSPGSRLWDIAYTAYRFIPLYPVDDLNKYKELSPFTKETMLNRLHQFLGEYSGNDTKLLYQDLEVLKMVEKRLKALAAWSKAFGEETQNHDIIGHANMYLLHAEWLRNELIKIL